MDENLPLIWWKDNHQHVCTYMSDEIREVVIAMIDGCLTEDPGARIQTPGIVWALQVFF